MDGFERHDSTHQDYIALLGAIIRSGIKEEGVDFLHGPDGQRLCLMGELDPEVVWTHARREERSKKNPSEGICRRRVKPATASLDGISIGSNDDPGQMERVPHSARKVLSDARITERYALVTPTQERHRRPRWYGTAVPV